MVYYFKFKIFGLLTIFPEHSRGRSPDDTHGSGAVDLQPYFGNVASNANEHGFKL